MTDLRLEKALEFANYRSTLAIQKQQLKDRCEARLNFAYNGGLFKIDQSLIALIGNFVHEQKTDIILLDSNQTPVAIENLSDFYNKITSLWFESVNEYHKQYQELANKRKVHKLVE